jgi:hypothetical protein
MPDDASNARLIPELPRLHVVVIDELKRRGVVRTQSNPAGDAERFVAQSLGLELQNNFAAGFDATGPIGMHSQIAARRVTPDNRSHHLIAIRKLNEADSSRLIGPLNTNFEVTDAYKIPHEAPPATEPLDGAPCFRHCGQADA